MKKNLRFYLFLGLVLVCSISIVACNNDSNSTISQNEAIAKAIKYHPEFPTNSKETITKNIPTGGPIGSNAKASQSSDSDAQIASIINDKGFDNLRMDFKKTTVKLKAYTEINVIIDANTGEVVERFMFR